MKTWQCAEKNCRSMRCIAITENDARPSHCMCNWNSFAKFNESGNLEDSDDLGVDQKLMNSPESIVDGLDHKQLKKLYARVLLRASDIGFNDEDWDEVNLMADNLIYKA